MPPRPSRLWISYCSDSTSSDGCGGADPQLGSGLRALAERHPTRIAVRVTFDEALSHRTEAGADFFVMPSRFEPCGLNQLYSLRYGTLPIVRLVGGLADTVVDYDARSRSGTGLLSKWIRSLG